MKARVLILAVGLSVTYSAMAQTYPVIWSDMVNTTITAGNTITKTSGSSAWDGGAASSNLLSGNTDGYLQFTYATSVNYYMVGLATFNGEPSYVSIDYAFYPQGNTLYLFEKSNNLGSFGTLVNGDILKVSREGLTVKYYKNGVVIRTAVITSAAAANELMPDATALQVGTVIPAPVVSFNTRMFNLKPQYTFPSLANNDGGITILPIGGDAPYTYVWSTGETTAGISSKPRGTYTVIVTDAASRSASVSYYLGYPVAWSNQDNTIINSDGSLSRTVPAGALLAGGSSLNTILPGTDGFIQFAVSDITSSTVVGLSDLDPDGGYTSIDFGIMAHINGNLYTNKGFTSTLVGPYKKGDIFKIERVGAVINYYRNGVQFSTNAVTAAVPLMVDIYMPYAWGSSPVVSASFEKKIRLKPAFTLPDNNNTNGSIALSVQGTYTPSTIAWTPGGETSNVITGKSRGTYTATVNDAAARSVVRPYRLGYPIVWTDLQGVQLNGDNTLTQISGPSWGAGAISGNVLSPNTDGWVEFVIPRGTGTTMIGLAKPNSAPGYNPIDYAFYTNNGSFLTIYELGGSVASFGYLVEGDVLTISREGSNVKYYINGNVVRTVATLPAYTLQADISFNGGIPSPLVTCSFSRTPQTYYSIASGNWNSPAIWSLTEGGAAASVYPAQGDIANIKGFTVTVNTAIVANTVNVIVNNDNTSLKVDTPGGQLTVKGQVNIQGISNVSTVKALQVQNDAKITIQP